mmetsp:Transcript_14229/g.35271  ORF Transcript_14229/g.35271 Transcript_14229/m.35271 type:complete len:210 (-) Transcript_14229:410-1039(-)
MFTTKCCASPNACCPTTLSLMSVASAGPTMKPSTDVPLLSDMTSVRCDGLVAYEKYVCTTAKLPAATPTKKRATMRMYVLPVSLTPTIDLSARPYITLPTTISTSDAAITSRVERRSFQKPNTGDDTNEPKLFTATAQPVYTSVRPSACRNGHSDGSTIEKTSDARKFWNSMTAIDSLDADLRCDGGGGAAAACAATRAAHMSDVVEHR